MMWAVAGGIIIGVGVLAVIYAGISVAQREPDPFWGGWIVALVGIALAIWIVFFKAAHG